MHAMLRLAIGDVNKRAMNLRQQGFLDLIEVRNLSVTRQLDCSAIAHFR
jgi:hypothetical protein